MIWNGRKISYFTTIKSREYHPLLVVNVLFLVGIIASIKTHYDRRNVIANFKLSSVLGVEMVE